MSADAAANHAPQTRPLTSVVIPTWNSTATLPAALASIEDPGATVEIIIVDDRSDDVAALQALAKADARVRLVLKPSRTNAAHSRALGLERAGGDLVLFLDSDDHYRPGHLARRRELHATQGASVVFGRFRLNDGVREWDGRMSTYAGGDFETYLFAQGGDARSSTISVDKTRLRGTTFDANLAKHQDWGFVLSAIRHGEQVGFDPVAGVTIGVSGAARMSGRSNVEASLAFARDYLVSDANRRRFLLGRLRTSLRLGDAAAAHQFRQALLEFDPTPRERWGSAAMMTAGHLGIARPLHRLLATKR